MQAERNCLRLAHEELKNATEENERSKVIVESNEGEIGMEKFYKGFNSIVFHCFPEFFSVECEEILKQKNETIDQLRAEYDHLLNENANKTVPFAKLMKEFC